MLFSGQKLIFQGRDKFQFTYFKFVDQCVEPRIE